MVQIKYINGKVIISKHLDLVHNPKIVFERRSIGWECLNLLDKMLNPYVNKDKFGIYKKMGVKIPILLRPYYKYQTKQREINIFSKYYGVSQTFVARYKNQIYFLGDVEILNESVTMEVLNLLRMN